MMRKFLQLLLLTTLALVATAGAQSRGTLWCTSPPSAVTPGHSAELQCYEGDDAPVDVDADLFAITAQDAIAIRTRQKFASGFDFSNTPPVEHITLKAAQHHWFSGFMPLRNAGQYIVRFQAGGKTVFDTLSASTIGVMTLIVAPSTRLYVPVDLTSFRVTRDIRNVVEYTSAGSRVLRPASDGVYADDTGNEDDKSAVYVEGTDGSVAFPELGWLYRANTHPLRFFVHTDRPLYRPGDEVSIRAILRTGTIGSYAVTRRPVTLDVIGGYPEHTVAHRTLVPNEFGTINTAFRLPADASLGSYRVEIDKAYSSGFDVEAYKKPEYVVTAVPASPYVLSGQTASFSVHVQYLFGTPAGGMQLKYNGNVFQNYVSFGYVPLPDSSRKHVYENDPIDGSTTADANGNATITVPTKALDADGNVRFSIDARDGSGRTVTAEAYVPIFAGTFDVAVSPGRWFAVAGKPTPITVSAFDHDHTPRKQVTVAVHIVETHWTEGKSSESDAGSVTLRTGNDGKAAFAFIAPHPGSYRFDAAATDERGNVVQGYSYQWVTDPESRWQPPAEQPMLVPAKTIFAPGEPIHVMLALNVPNRDAVVTVLDDRLVEHRIVHVSGYTADLAISAPRDAQHLRVTASVPGENGVSQADVAVNILPPVTALTITARPDRASYQPRQNAVVRIHAVDAHGRPVRAELSLAVVDEGIFAMQDQVLDPNQVFYGTLGWTRYYADWYAPNRYALKTIAKVTSSSAGGLVKPGVAADTYAVSGLQNVALRSQFLDTAYWTPAVVTDKNGNAVVHFRWPENLTTWRATTLGVTPRTQLGVAVSHAVVTKPLLVRLETPRFLRAGDHAQVTGIVHGKFAAEPVRMHLEANALASPEPVRAIRLDANRTASEAWSVSAPGVGSANVDVRAIGPSGSDGMQVMLPLLGGTALEHTRDAGIAHSSVTIPLTLAPGEMQGDVHLSFSPSPLAELVETLRDFDVYPYYCTEQTSSNALVAVAVLEAAKSLPGVRLSNDPQRVIDRALARLTELRHSDGWGWWEYDKSDVDMTAYALVTIAAIESVTGTKSDLQYAGENALHAAMGHGISDSRSLAYAAYALTQIHSYVPQTVQRELSANVGRAKPYEAAMIGLTAVGLGDDGLADRAVARLLSTADSNGGTMSWHDERWTWMWWNDPIDATAYAVRLLEARHHEREAEAGLAFLRANRNGNWWYTTKDTAAAAMTLARFERAAPATSTNQVVNVLVDGKLARSVHMTQLIPDASDARVVLPASMLQGAKEITLDHTTSGALYWSSDDVRYADRNAAQTRDASEGVLARLFASPPAISVNRRYTVDHAGPWRVGDIVTVDLWITARDGAQYVTIEDPFPAGVEYQPIQGEYGTGGYWWNGMQFLDDRAAFFISGLWPRDTFHLTYQLRATTPGTFVAPGPSAYASYGPPVSAVGTGEEVVIR